MKQITLLLFAVLCTMELQAQSISEHISRMHTQLLTGVSVQSVKRQMTYGDVIDECYGCFGRKYYVTYRIYDNYEIRYAFGEDNRLKHVSLYVPHDRIYEYEFAQNGFLASEYYEGIVVYKNNLTKTKLLLLRALGRRYGGWNLLLDPDGGFVHMSVKEYKDKREQERRVLQAREDSIALAKAKLDGVQLDPKICNEFSDTLANRVIEFIRDSSDVVDYARVKFDNKIEVSENGIIRKQDYSIISSVDEWEIKNYINATKFSFPPQTVTIGDTTIAVWSWGYVSVSCEYDKKELRVKWDGRDLVYKGKTPEFYNKHYDYFRWFVEANGQGTGVYDLSVVAIKKNGNVTYDTSIFKFKPIKSKTIKIPIPIKGDVYPKFQGGDAQDFAKWVNSRLVYPELAKGEGISGVVKYQFTVCEDGFVRDVRILESPDIMLEREVIRVVMFSPKWEPGYNDGKPVSVSYTSTVTFSLR